MTNEEIIIKIQRAEKALNTDLPEDAKARLRATLENLKAQIEKTEEKAEKKEEKLQAEEKKIQSEIEKKIERAEKALNTDMPEDAKSRLRKTLENLKEELAKQKAEIKEDVKESAKETKEIKAAVKKLAEVAKKAGKVKGKKIPKVVVKEEQREKKSEKRQSKLKGMMDELQKLIHNNKFLASKYEGKGVDLKRDAARPAKPFGYRFTGKDNFAVPTKEQIKKGLKDGSVDYEGRANRSDKTPKKEYKLAHGGDVDGNQNAEMVLSKAKELHHHASELENVVKPNSDVEAWEVAKMERAATDASDVTHYEDGKGSSTEYSEYFAKGGIVIGLVDPNKDKTIKTITLDRNYRESEEEVTKLNEKLNKKSNPKELYWRVIQIGSMAKGGKVGMPEWAVTITSEDGESYDWDGFAKDEDDALNKAEKEAGFESVESGVNMVTDKNGKKVAYKKGGKLSSKAKYIPKRDIEEVEIDQNGKEVELDGADLLDGIYVKKSSYTKKKGAGRPPAKKATGGPVKAKSNRKGGKSVGQIAALAKQIRKEGEKWTDAIKRASAQLKSKI